MSAFLLILTSCIVQKKYYIDSRKGNDANSGTLKKPFRSVEQINAHKYKSGHSILLAGGQVYEGTIRLRDLNKCNSCR